MTTTANRVDDPSSRPTSESDSEASGPDAHRWLLLATISQALFGTLNLKSAMQNVLDLLARLDGAIRGVVTLVQEDGTLSIEASENSEPPGAPVKAGTGRGIEGRVVDTGRAVIVSRASGEPLLRHRVPKRSESSQTELSVICVPISLNRQAIGALTIDLEFKPDRNCDLTSQFLGVVASMVGQAIGIQRLVEEDRRRLEADNSSLHHQLRERHDVANIIGTTGPMRVIYDQVARLAGTNMPVLLFGESGTGKALIARAIHYHSLRAKKPFVNVSCLALSGARIESELFGHQGGVFAGTDLRTQGRVELAEGGSLFLDEISHTNASTQVRLLRLMQEHEFERLGGMETLKANVRVIAATEADLEAATVERVFLEDLYRTLSVCAIVVPPLRHRKADLLLLVDHFLEKLSCDHHKPLKRVSTPAVDVLMSHHWPGNVRELKNALEHAVRVCDGQVIHAHHLPLTVRTGDMSGTVSLHDAVNAYEADLILGALRATRGHRSRAARLLGTTERILNYRVKTLCINYRRFRL